jgi:ribosome-binding factor A
MSQRVLRVSELVKRELSMVLERLYRMDNAILTVHEVRATPDLKQCFAYIGIIATGGVDEEGIIEKLNKQRGAIQREVHKRVIMKNSPQIFFRLDKSVAYAFSMPLTISPLLRIRCRKVRKSRILNESTHLAGR